MTAEGAALRADALDFVVRLMFELGDSAADSDPFHDRICEAVCVFRDQPAIRLTSANETRHSENRPILPGGSSVAPESSNAGEAPAAESDAGPYGSPY